MLDLISAIVLTAVAAIVAVVVVLTFGATRRERIGLAVGLATWLLAVVAAGATRLLYYDGGLGVPGLAIAIVLPIALLCAVAFGTRRGRERVAVAPLSALVGVQAVRVVGVFFVLLHAAGRLPAPFAPTAGWGDIAVGLLALPVAGLAARQAVSARGAVLALTLFGIADLVAAVGLGATSSPGPVRIFFDEPSSALMTTLPWILIPCLLVPALMALHLVVLVKLATPSGSRGANNRGAPRASSVPA
ncbi:MAG: hypothetical protein ABI460_13565 [Caldimonas sp.]